MALQNYKKYMKKQISKLNYYEILVIWPLQTAVLPSNGKDGEYDVCKAMKKHVTFHGPSYYVSPTEMLRFKGYQVTFDWLTSAKASI